MPELNPYEGLIEQVMNDDTVWLRAYLAAVSAGEQSSQIKVEIANLAVRDWRAHNDAKRRDLTQKHTTAGNSSRGDSRKPERAGRTGHRRGGRR